MIVLGIDPGIANTGYGIVSSGNSRLQALEFGVIETAAGVAPEARLAEIHTDVGELIARFSVDAVAIEDLYFGANVVSAMAVGQARGVVLWPPASTGCRRARTPRSRSRPRSAEVAAPTSSRWDGWLPGCLGWRRRPDQTTQPMRWPSPSATSTVRRLRTRSQEQSRDCSGERHCRGAPG